MNLNRLTCRQVTVLALRSLMEVWGGWWIIIVFWNFFNHTIHLFNESFISVYCVLTLDSVSVKTCPLIFLQVLQLSNMLMSLHTGTFPPYLRGQASISAITSCLSDWWMTLHQLCWTCHNRTSTRWLQKLMSAPYVGVSQFIVCTQLGRFALDKKGNSLLLSVVNIVLRFASSHFNASSQSRNLPNCSNIQLTVELDIAL